MNKRWLVGGVVVAGIGAFFIFHDRGKASAMTKPTRDGQVPIQVAKLDVPQVAADPFKPNPPPAPVKPHQVYNPKNDSYEMPVIDAVPDPEGAAREEFLYRVHRLKLSLADEAARCYSGPDLKEEIKISYTMVIENEVLRADNVSVVENNISDPAVVACVLSSIRDMRTLVEKMPNEKQDTQFYMSLHDFYVRNKQDDSGAKKHTAEPLTEFDRPTVVPLPPSK